MKIINVSRRDFLKAGAFLGGGLVLGFTLPLGERLLLAETSVFAPNAFLRIGADDSVTVIVPQSEMGQGVLTSLPMLVAEELEVDWSKVRFEQGPAAKVYANPIIGMQLTGGSTSVRAFWEPLRKAGASARIMLIQAAARAWNVDAGACRAEGGMVIHPPSGRKLAYGALTEKAAAMPVPKNVTLKDPGSFRMLGKPARRLDNPVKINGSAVFGIDVRQPGMLVAVVARCPVFGGKVASYDDGDARRVPGVRRVLPVSSGVAVAADTFWAAKKGRDALKITWDEGPLASLTSDGITRLFAAAAKENGLVARNDGDTTKALAGSSKKIEAVYEVPYLAHATMEPMNCAAHVRRNGCEVWVPTQGQTLVQRAAAQITGFPPDSIVVHTTYLGGGFGRRAEQDFVAEAVEVSKAVQAPVKVVWTREDDMQHDHYRPATYNRFTAGLDAKGEPVAWMHRIVGPSIFAAHAQVFGSPMPDIDRASVEGAADLPYGIPNLRVEYIRKEPGIPVGFWRSVGHSQNTFITESFLDEIAATANRDPYEMRRTLLNKHPRHLGVLELAASRAGWGGPLPKGRYRGIAVAEAYGSFIAEVAEVSVSGGAVRVHRVVCAVDCGWTVNPETIESQVQGGVVFGLTAALKGAITIDRGRVRESNFHDYQLLRINDMPVVEVHIVKSREAPGGMGEVAVPPIAPAVANAVFAATGKRVRRLPIRAEDLA